MLWIIIPVFNEEKSLHNLLPAINRIMIDRDQEYRLVVVNDGSNDCSGDILESYKTNLPLIVLTHPINRGLGETERDGFEYVAWHASPEDLIIRIEGDDTHDPEFVFSMIDKLKEGYDVVNTSRFVPGGGQIGLDTYRSVVSRLANSFMQIVFHIKGVSDYSCGFRVYRVSVLQDAIRIFGDHLIQLRGLGFTSTLEIMVKLKLMGCRCAEVPFVLHYEKKQSPSKMISSITSLGYIVMAILYHWPFGGWHNQYLELADMYSKDPVKAVASFGVSSHRFYHPISQISL